MLCLQQPSQHGPPPKQHGLDTNLRRLKAEHLKKRGDEAFKESNYRQAWERYTEALELHPDKAALHLLHANRSAAYCQGGRLEDALAAGDAAARLSPQWAKGHWRRGAALLALRRHPEAALAYQQAWRLSKGEGGGECGARLWQVVQRLTREQLGGAILALLADAEAAGALAPAEVEAVSEQEMREGFFRVVHAAHRGQPKPGAYYTKYLGWLKGSMAEHEGYTERAAMYTAAKCFLQGRADGEAAAQACLRRLASADRSGQQKEAGGDEDGDGAGETPALRRALARAYLRWGQACLAEAKHEDRCCRSAFKAFSKGQDLDPGCEELQAGLQEASDDLSKEELEQAVLEAYHEGTGAAGGGRGLGALHAPRPGERVFRVAVQLAFPQGIAAALTARPRELLRGALAACAGVDAPRATIERVLPPGGRQRRPHLGVVVHVQVGADVLKASALAQAVQDASRVADAIGGPSLAALLGPVDPAGCSAEIEDITPACAVSEAEQAQHRGEGEGSDSGGGKQERRLVVPSRPKLELELPYRMYRLVRADGTALERADKHPFCMSRVYYDAAEKPEEAWAEMADGSCRWRQTGSEVKVIALKVPADLPPRLLQVTIAPHHIKVGHAESGEVYLEGELERGVVPDDSAWTHCGGAGEDGCALFLRKMNLELLQRHWMHSEMWWPRLFAAHSEISWDDYEKDYSDLPAEVLRRHRVTEAIKDDERRVETGEKEKREELQERDDARKRARQERLHELRSGSRRSWVALHRGE